MRDKFDRRQADALSTRNQEPKGRRTRRKALAEIHPGEILIEDFMKPMGITSLQLAADIDVPPSRVSDIVRGQRPITVDTALRLGLFFKMDARFWLNLQSEYDLRVASRSIDQVAKRVRVFEAPAEA